MQTYCCVSPKAKNKRNRAKKRGPIIAEIKKNNLIDLYLRQLKHTTNLRFVKNLFTHVFTANRHGFWSSDQTARAR